MPRPVIVGTALGLLSLIGCHSKSQGGAPKISSIPPQVVEEGNSFELDLKPFIIDLEGDGFQVEKISGPGRLSASYPTIVWPWPPVDLRLLYTYQDLPDADIIDNNYVVTFRAVDINGKESRGSFNLVQKDTFPQVLQPSSFRLSSNLESIIVDDFGGYYPDARGFAQNSIAVNSRLEPVLAWVDGNITRPGGLTSIFASNNLWIKDYHGGFSGFQSLVFDSADNLHFCYSTPRDSEELRYKKLVGGQWMEEIVDSSSSVGLANDLALDQNNKVHISHYAWNGSRLKYSTNVSGGWVTETLSPTDWTSTSIATDLQNKAHIIYITPGDIISHLHNSSSVWQQENISQGNNPVIRRDRQGELHVAFEQVTLMHAVRRNSNWIIETLPSQVNPNGRISFEIDNNDKLWMGYTSNNRDNLYILTNYDGSWREHQIDNGGDWISPRIYLDNQNNIHIIGARQGKVHYIKFNHSQLPQ
ncbi:hypothetical protein J4423_02375 [Candidatus Pacearchaeota archaeon]|nr:hypothetical protein [Candidatus Pacearchaeota archaeon]